MTTLDQRADMTRVALPPAADLAAAIEGGTSAATLADRYGCSVSTVRNRLNRGGFNSGTGEPTERRPVVAPTSGFAFQPEPWTAEGLCHQPGMDPAWWDNDTAASPGAKYALQVCGACPVRDACLAYALRTETTSTGRWGIYGGTLPEDRAALGKRGVA